MSETTLRPPGARLPTLRTAVTSPSVALTAIIVGGTLVRILLSAGRDFPRYLPDEYLYPELARSIAAGDGSAVLGQHASFPALLEPLLIAPLWGSLAPAAAIQATQVLHAFVLALAAIPVYAIGRQVALSTRASLLCAAAAVAAPGAFFAGLMTADAVGYLLVLTSIAVAVRALSTPTLVGQAVFLATAGLATAARLQYAVLLPAYAVGALVVERRLGRTVRSQPLAVAMIAAGLLALPLVAPRMLGRYEEATAFGASMDAMLWVASGGFLLILATGLAITPGAVAWFAATIIRPTGRAQAALAGITMVVLALLLVAASVMTVETASDRFMERYLVVAAPLVAVAFGCWLTEGLPARWVAVALGLALVVAAAQLPLSEWTGGQGVADSPTLLALSRLEPPLGVAGASAVAAALITVGGLLAALVAVRPRLRSVVVGATALLLVAISLGAHARDIAASSSFRASMLKGDPSWIDARAPGDALLVQTRDSTRFDAMLTILFNASVRRAAPLGRDDVIDGFDGLAPASLAIARDGRLLQDGAPVRGPVVWALGGTAAAFDDVLKVTYDQRFALVLPREEVRVAMTAEGLRYDSSVSKTGVLTVYPTADGRCTTLDVRLRVPPGVPATELAIQRRGRSERIMIRPGAPTRLVLTSQADRPTRLSWKTTLLGDRAPSLFDVTVAFARYASSTVPCAAQGTST